MKVVYTAPNRAHHFRYAAALQKAGCLEKFVSGFPRLSARGKLSELNGKVQRADLLQTVYIASLKVKSPSAFSDWLAYLSKIEQDHSCRRFIDKSDIFLFYNGSGLSTCRYGKKKGIINIVEAVNTHVEYQEELLAQEYNILKLKWKPFPAMEKKRRIKEYEEADYILLPSEFVKKSFIEKGFDSQKLLKVPYGFTKSNFNKFQKRETASNSFTVLYVGSISVRKGIRYLIEAFKKLTHPNKKLLLVGPDASDGALNGILLTPDILFPGILKDKRLDDVYRSADVFCLPSIEDGFGLVLGEALSAGLPIIATTNTGALDIVDNGVEGFIVSIRDSESILSKLQMLADEPQLLKQISLNALAKAEKLNGWEDTSKNLIETLQKVYKYHNRS